jgi:hypothetical protein
MVLLDRYTIENNLSFSPVLGSPGSDVSRFLAPFSVQLQYTVEQTTATADATIALQAFWTSRRLVYQWMGAY